MVRIDFLLFAGALVVGIIGYLPLFPYLDVFATWTFPAALCYGAWAERCRSRGLHGRPATLATVALFLFYLLQVRHGEIVNPAVNLLVTLLAVRFVGEKTPRTYLQIYALSLFTLAASTLFDLAPTFLLLMMLQVLVICLSLVLLTASAEDVGYLSKQQLSALWRRSVIMPLIAFPLMALFFIILPRTQFPLWNIIAATGASTTGFSEQVRPGAARSYGEVKKVAFRAAGRKLAEAQPYWRGIVLNSSSSGGVWKRTEPPEQEREWPRGGERVTFLMYPEPSPYPYLLMPDAPVSVTGVRRSHVSPDLVVTAPLSGQKRKYEAVGTSFDHIVSRTPPSDFYRQLPAGSFVFAEVASRVAAQKDDEAKIAALENEFLSRRISYALTGLPTGEKALEEFFFSKRMGHCELFASAAATILRRAGVPARLVGGYLGGQYNDMAGYYIVTEDMAHVWVEAYIKGKGWVRIDPSRWAVNFSSIKRQKDEGLINKVSLALDSFSYFWDQAVTTYDLDKQLRLLQAAGARAGKIASPQLSRKTLIWMGLVLVIFATAFSIRRRQVPVERQLVNRFIEKMRRVYGMETFSPSTPLIEGAAATKDPAAIQFASIYSAAIFHDRRLSAEEIRMLKRLIKSIGQA